MREREVTLADHRQMDALAELTAEFKNIRAAWHRAVQERDYAGIDRARGGAASGLDADIGPDHGAVGAGSDG